MIEQETQVAEFARVFVPQTLLNALVRAPSCSLMQPTKVSTLVHKGWSFAMYCCLHPAGLVSTEPVYHYHLSAKLSPPGRGSTEEDWGNLGMIVRGIVLETGFSSEKQLPDPILPIEETGPNGVVHWMWHNDSSKVDSEVLAGIQQVLRRVNKYVAEQQEQQRRHQEQLVTQSIKNNAPGRNEACPCGSGKKYKKCHGAPS